MTQPRWRDQEATAAYRDTPDAYDDFYRSPRDGESSVGGGSRRPASRGRPGRRWGALPGMVGVCMVVGSAALGALLTALTNHEPGAVLGVFLVAGTFIGALAVRPRSGYLLIPVPALSYLVAGSIAGAIYDRANDSTHAAMALNATQWIADGFVAMAIATALAIVITTLRLIMGAVAGIRSRRETSEEI